MVKVLPRAFDLDELKRKTVAAEHRVKSLEIDAAHGLRNFERAEDVRRQIAEAAPGVRLHDAFAGKQGMRVVDGDPAELAISFPTALDAHRALVALADYLGRPVALDAPETLGLAVQHWIDAAKAAGFGSLTEAITFARIARREIERGDLVDQT